jgi:hypothetical protein
MIVIVFMTECLIFLNISDSACRFGCANEWGCEQTRLLVLRSRWKRREKEKERAREIERVRGRPVWSAHNAGSNICGLHRSAGHATCFLSQRSEMSKAINYSRFTHSHGSRKQDYSAGGQQLRKVTAQTSNCSCRGKKR